MDKFKYILLGLLLSTPVLAEDNLPPQIDLPSPGSKDDELNDPLLGTSEEIDKLDASEAKPSEVAAPAMPAADDILTGQPTKPEDKAILDKAIKEVFDEPKKEEAEKPVQETKPAEVKKEEKAPADDIDVSVTGESATPAVVDEAATPVVEAPKTEEKPAEPVVAETKPATEKVKKPEEEKAPVAPEKFAEEPKKPVEAPKVDLPAESPKSVRESYESNFDGKAVEEPAKVATKPVKKIVKKAAAPTTSLPANVYLLNNMVPNAPKVNVPVHATQPTKVKNKTKAVPKSMQNSIIPSNTSPSMETVPVNIPGTPIPRQLPDSLKQGSLEENDLDIITTLPEKNKRLNIKEDITIDRGEFNNPFPDKNSETPELSDDQALAETTTTVKKKDDSKDESGAPVVDFSDTAPVDLPESKIKSETDQQPENFYMQDAGLDVQVKDAPKNSVGVMKNAYDALQVGQYESAINYYNDALEIVPNDRKALFGLATAYHMNKQYDQAREVYLKLIKLDPDYWPAVNNYIIMVTEENPEKSLPRLEDLYARNPTFAAIPAQIGSLYFKKGDLKESAKYYLNAVKLEPRNIDYRYNLAVILEKAGNYRDASVIYKTLLEDAAKGTKLPEDPVAIKDRFDEMLSKS